jgi:antitoxin (DNA-binding transcriptional repressor) of toxin-antitoxin stability system
MVMKKVNIADAKAKLADLISRAEKGERIVLSRRNQPVAELRALKQHRNSDRPAGLCAGEFVVPEDFDAPLPDEVLRGFEGH